MPVLSREPAVLVADLLICQPLNSFLGVEFNLFFLKENESNVSPLCTIHLLNYAHFEELVLPE